MVVYHLPRRISAKRVCVTRGTMQPDGRRRGGGQSEVVEKSAGPVEITRRHAVSCEGSSFQKEVTRDRHHYSRLSLDGGSLAFRSVLRGRRVAPATLRLSRYPSGMCYFSIFRFMVVYHLPRRISAKRVCVTRGMMQPDGRRRGGGQSEVVEKSAGPVELTRRHAVSCEGSSFQK